MGHTKTICRCRGRLRATQEWEKLNEHRSELKEALEEYLENDACVKGVEKDVSGLDSYADSLSSAFVSVVKIELSGHKTETESCATMNSFSAIFAEMWRLPAMAGTAEFSPLNAGREANVPGISSEKLLRLAEQSKPDIEKEPQHSEVIHLAGLLGKSYPKALAEMRQALKGDDVYMIKHHGSLLGDILGEMLDLIQYLDPRDEHISEYDLPEDHPHWRARPE